MIFVLVYFLALKGKPVNSFVFIVLILIDAYRFLVFIAEKTKGNP